MLVTSNIKHSNMLVTSNMNEERINEALANSNKWWKGLFELEFKPREIYAEVKRFFPKKQIIALVGLRRTGKTTIMLKLVEEALVAMEKEHVVYFSFDEFKNIELRDIIKNYERLMKKDVSKGKYLFLFDEIQKIENWEEQLKRLYDENQNIKFIISGSESLFIRKKSRESLAGRMYEFQIKTLNFKEYLNFKDKSFDNYQLHKEEILKEFHNFIICNGFPEIIAENKEDSAKYIKENVIERIIYRDIPQIVKIADPAILEQIFRIILYSPGEIINMGELAKDLGIARQTVSIYLDYLEKSYLVKKLYNYSRNVRKTQKRFKKYYPIIIAPDIAEKQEYFGKVFETVLVNHLNAEFFWRDNFKNEVDIIQVQPLTAIEVKSGEIKERDLTSLNRFIKKFKPEKAIVLSYDIKKTIESIQIMPFYEYLLDNKPSSHSVS